MYGQFFLLFAVVFTGYFLRLANFIDSNMNKGLNKFIVYFAYPCLLVKCIGTLDLSTSLMLQFIEATVIVVVMFFLFALVMRFYAKTTSKDDSIRNVFELASISPNNGFMGFPVALAFFGSRGLFFMVAHNVAMSLFVFTYGLLRLRGEKAENASAVKLLKTIGKVFLNPNVFSVGIGFLICIYDISLDNNIGEYLTMIGNVATPMAMVFIGSTLAENRLFDIVKIKIVWESAGIKLFALPIISMLLVYAAPLNIILKQIIVLAFALPTGTVIPMLAEQEGQNRLLGSQIMFITTVLSMGTLPIFVFIINSIII